MENNTYISNLDSLNQKIEQMKKQGASNLHIVSDFDRTLTKNFHEGKKLPSAVSLIRSGGYLTKDYPEKAYALFDKYHPYEIDLSIPFEERSKKMTEWWEEHKKLFIASKMRKEIILDIVQKNTCIFREYANEVFDLLKEKDIPILIFSAGIGNIIEEFLKIKNKLTPNVYILSNTFVFNEDGNATGYEGPIIHVFNKSEAQLKDPKYTKIIKERKNIILLGDNIEDLQMVENIDKNLLITIGFLNSNTEENLEKYKEKFDIVITNDGSMKYVYDLVKEIIQN